LTKGAGSDVNPYDGDRVKIEVDLEGGVVMAARVDVSGCEISTKASSALARLVRGRSRTEALATSLSDVTGQIGPVHADREPCVLTGIRALRAAIVDAHVKAIA
jgi:NifU-like protein involved in Fe-S cluster formation